MKNPKNGKFRVFYWKRDSLGSKVPSVIDGGKPKSRHTCRLAVIAEKPAMSADVYHFGEPPKQPCISSIEAMVPPFYNPESTNKSTSQVSWWTSRHSRKDKKGMYLIKMGIVVLLKIQFKNCH